MRAVRPGVALRRREEADELVLLGGGEVFRLPLTPEAVARQAVLVRALPVLRTAVPVAVPLPRYVGVLDDGATPFTAERRLPGTRPVAVEGIAAGQLAGVVAALAAVPVREAKSWGVPGDGDVLVHEALESPPSAGLDVLLADPRTGLLTGVVAWRLRLVRGAGVAPLT